MRGNIFLEIVFEIIWEIISEIFFETIFGIIFEIIPGKLRNISKRSKGGTKERRRRKMRGNIIFESFLK